MSKKEKILYKVLTILFYPLILLDRVLGNDSSTQDVAEAWND